MEIRDIKIINQCLEVQGGVVACLFSFSLSLSLCSSHATCLPLFFLSLPLSFAFSLEVLYSRSPEVSPVKWFLNAATQDSAPLG